MINEKIKQIAIVGTDKRFFNEEELSTLRKWGIVAENGAQSNVLLKAAAITSRMDKAGFKAESVTTQVPMAKVEELAVIPQNLNMHLRGALDQNDFLLVEEILRLMVFHQKRVQHDLLPELLNWGNRNKKAQELICRVIGVRGIWLANYLNTYEYVAPETINPDWELATFSERKELIKKARTDHPTRAIELLQLTWEQDDPVHKAAFLEHFEEGLSKADEAFLITASNDRRKEVRDKAINLLLQIPGSAYLIKVEKYIRQHIILNKSLLKGTSLEIQLPQEYDKRLAELGVNEKVKIFENLGEKANWLAQVMLQLPPATWKQWMSTSAEKVLKIVSKGEWTPLLLTSIMSAAVLHKDQEFLKLGLTQEGMDIKFSWNALATALTKESFQELLRFYNSKGYEVIMPDAPLYQLLHHTQFPIGHEYAIRLISMIQDIIRNNGQQYNRVVDTHRTLLKDLSFRLPPEKADQYVSLWREDTTQFYYWANSISEFNNRLILRKEIYQAFNA